MKESQQKNEVDLLTLSEAARESGISIHTLSSRVSGGSMRCYRRQARTYVTLEDIGNWVPKWYRGHEIAILEAHTAGEPDAYIARKLGLSRERIRQIRGERLGLPANPPKPYLPKEFAPREA